MSGSFILVLPLCLLILTGGADATISISADFLTPDLATITGGDPLVVKGTGFSGAVDPVVHFETSTSAVHGVALCSVRDDTTMDCTSPSSYSGPLSVTAKLKTNSGSNVIGTESVAFTFFNDTLPQVSTISPSDGPSDAVTTVVLTGQDLVPSSFAQCFINGFSVAANVTGNSVSCDLPALNPNSNNVVWGSYNVTFSLIGSNTTIVNSPLLFTYRAPAPLISSLELSPSFQELVLSWNFHVTPNPSSCSDIWTPESYDLLGGADASCSWVTESKVIVRLGSSTSRSLLASVLSPKADTFGRLGGALSFLFSGSKAISVGSFAPIGSILGPSYITRSCAENHLSLQAVTTSAPGYLDLMYSWTVASTTGKNVSHLATAISQFDGPEIQLSNDNFTDLDILQFTCTLKNFNNDTSTFGHLVEIGSANALSGYIAEGSSISRSRSMDITLNAKALISPCDLQTVTYAWELHLNGSSSLISLSATDRSVLTIPANTLAVGSLYIANVKMSAGGVEVSKSISINTVATTMKGLVILGGDRSVQVGEKVNLTAILQSADTVAATNYQWSIACSDATCPSVDDSNSLASITVPAVPVGSTLTVTATAMESGTTLTTTSSLTVVATSTNLVYLRQFSDASPVSSSQSIVLRAAVRAMGIGIVEWSGVDDAGFSDRLVLSSTNTGSDISYPVVAQQSNTSVIMSGKETALDLVLKPNMLQDGGRYKFRVTVSTTEGISWATCVVDVAFTAQGGSLVYLSNLLSPSVSAASMPFDPSYPPVYEFEIEGQTNEWHTIRYGSASVISQLQLPSGSIQLRCTTTDSLERSQTVTVAAVVASQDGVSDHLAAVTSVLTAFQSDGDWSQALGDLAGILVSAVKQSPALTATVQESVSTKAMEVISTVGVSASTLPQVADVCYLTSQLSIQTPSTLATLLKSISAQVANGPSKESVALDVLKSFDNLIPANNLAQRNSTTDISLFADFTTVVENLGTAMCDLALFGTDPVTVASDLGSISTSRSVPSSLEQSGVSIAFGSSLQSQYDRSECAAQIFAAQNYDASNCAGTCIANNQVTGDTYTDPSSTPIGATLRSKPAVVELSSGGSDVSIKNQAGAIVISFTVEPKQFGGDYECRFFNTSTNIWAKDGCEVTASTSTTIECTCSHLTSFGVFEVCPPGFVGPSCTQICDASFWGQDCLQQNLCSGNGLANHVTGVCDCTAPGVTGSDCNTACPTGWGVQCVNTCLCQNNGTCNPVNGNCTCKDGYSGSVCETDIQECITESVTCQNGGTCNDEVNGWSCACIAGFTGTNCEVNTNECASSPCYFGTCVDGVNDYSCTCQSGRTGKNCDTVCDQGTFGSSCQSTCECNTEGGQCEPTTGDCVCFKGYSGTLCESRNSYIPWEIIIPCLLIGLLLLVLLILYLYKRKQNRKTFRVVPHDPFASASSAEQGEANGDPLLTLFKSQPAMFGGLAEESPSNGVTFVGHETNSEAPSKVRNSGILKEGPTTKDDPFTAIDPEVDEEDKATDRTSKTVRFQSTMEILSSGNEKDVVDIPHAASIHSGSSDSIADNPKDSEPEKPIENEGPNEQEETVQDDKQQTEEEEKEEEEEEKEEKREEEKEEEKEQEASEEEKEEEASEEEEPKVQESAFSEDVTQATSDAQINQEEKNIDITSDPSSDATEEPFGPKDEEPTNDSPSGSSAADKEELTNDSTSGDEAADKGEDPKEEDERF